MNGTIEVESELGTGTKTTLYLNFERVYDVNEEAVVEKPVELSLEGKKVLLCEDHPLNAEIMKRLLEHEGVVMEHAQNGQIGVEKFEASKPGDYDLILMDVRMPVMDGLEATRIIRNLDRIDAKEIPIIAVTANAFDEDIEDSKKAGMNDHLSKPIEPEKLKAVITQYLSQTTIQ